MCFVDQIYHLSLSLNLLLSSNKMSLFCCVQLHISKQARGEGSLLYEEILQQNDLQA